MRNRAITNTVIFILVLGLISALIAGIFAVGTVALADSNTAITGSQPNTAPPQISARDRDTDEMSSYKHLKKPFARFSGLAVG